MGGRAERKWPTPPRTPLPLLVVPPRVSTRQTAGRRPGKCCSARQVARADLRQRRRTSRLPAAAELTVAAHERGTPTPTSTVSGR